MVSLVQRGVKLPLTAFAPALAISIFSSSPAMAQRGEHGGGGVSVAWDTGADLAITASIARIVMAGPTAGGGAHRHGPNGRKSGRACALTRCAMGREVPSSVRPIRARSGGSLAPLAGAWCATSRPAADHPPVEMPSLDRSLGTESLIRRIEQTSTFSNGVARRLGRETEGVPQLARAGSTARARELPRQRVGSCALTSRCLARDTSEEVHHE